MKKTLKMEADDDDSFHGRNWHKESGECWSRAGDFRFLAGTVVVGTAAVVVAAVARLFYP